MSALLVVIAAALAAQAPAPAPQKARAVMLPVRLPDDAGPELVSAAAGVERALVDALGRHASFRVMTRSEIAALAGTAQREQLMGCDAEGCIAEIADALGAEFVIAAQMDHTDNAWNLRASLLDRLQAQAVRRAQVSARSLNALISSMDTIARQLAGGSTAALEDPRLAERLGTTPEEATAFARSVPQGVDVSTAWTDHIVERNGESEIFPLVESGLLLAIAGLFVFHTLATIPANYFFQTIEIANAPPVATSLRDPRNPDGTYNYPVGLMLLTYGPVPLLVVAVTLLAGAFVVTSFVDWLDLGRVPVKREGCCRDERRIRAAEKPGLGRRLAPYIAAAAGGLVAATPVVGFIATIPLGIIVTAFIISGTPIPPGPTVAVPPVTYVATSMVLQLVLNNLLFAFGVTSAITGIIAAAVLIYNERSTLTEE